jgi:membrane protein implicated in regulation of membrane protease activity
VTFTAKTRRRWFGSLCLLAALVMLALGETTPGGHLNGVAFVIYWLACFVFAALAMLAAILDARALRREARAEQRALLENTLAEIEKGKVPRAKRQTSNNHQVPNSDSPPAN